MPHSGDRLVKPTKLPSLFRENRQTGPTCLFSFSPKRGTLFLKRTGREGSPVKRKEDQALQHAFPLLVSVHRLAGPDLLVAGAALGAGQINRKREPGPRQPGHLPRRRLQEAAGERQALEEEHPAGVAAGLCLRRGRGPVHRPALGSSPGSHWQTRPTSLYFLHRGGPCISLSGVLLYWASRKVSFSLTGH